MSSYQHKSGALKRKLKSEKQVAETKGRQAITKFFKNSDSDVTQCPVPSVPTDPGSSSSASVSSAKNSENKLDDESSATKDSNSARRESDDLSEFRDVRECDIQESESLRENLQVPTCNESLPSVSDLRDPQKWPKTITDAVRIKIVSCSASFDDFSRQSKQFPNDASGHSFAKSFLYSKSVNGRERYPRDWLIWSVSKQTLHCLPCLLFEENYQASNVRSNFAKREGFCCKETRWKKLYDRLPAHESSSEHRNCYTQWKSLMQSIDGAGLDSELRKQEQCEIDKWKAILQRILDVTLFLASRGLPFQGDNTKIGDVHNGNFLGVLELLGKYDEVTREHLAKVKAKQLEGKTMQGQAHYLSWKSQNEFISLCGDKVLRAILDERNEAIYYGIIADATPDIEKKEQNVLIVRYVAKDVITEKFDVFERFLKFLDFNEKTGKDITDEILSALENNKIPLEDCRAQGYDGGSNMVGKVKGVKTRILEKNKLALFSPCGAHSLNRVGVNAAKVSPEAKKFFGNLESLYVLFSGSPARWEILLEEIPMSLKSMPETRWSERKEAVLPLARHYPGVLKAIDRLLHTDLPPKSYSTALGLKTYFSSFEGLIMTAFWQKTLACIDEKNIIIQSPGISLDVEVKLINDLNNDIQRLRDSWDVILNESRLIAEQLGIATTFVDKRNRDQDDSLNMFRTDVVFSVLDFILQDLKSRYEEVNFIANLFIPILKYMTLDDEELKLKADSLVTQYKKDISKNFCEEIVHLKHVSASVFGSKTEISPIELLNKIYEKKLEQIFINVITAIRLFLTFPVTVSSGERAFSKLSNTLKTWQRASTGQDRLNSLALLSIEHRLASTLDFSNVIRVFSSLKARKKIW